MKSSAVFSCLILLATAVSASPVEHRWEVVPDSDGSMHLVDLDSVGDSVEPSYVPETDLVFLLFTRQNPTVGQVIRFNDPQSVANSNFNPSHPTRLTLHGWNGSPRASVNVLVTAAFLRAGEFNMIVVDWTAGGTTSNYITARNRVVETGQFVGRFVDFLHANNFVRFPDLHLIGHSLGAHVAGVAGKHVTRGRVQVIMGLDPAGPLFTMGNPEGRVAPGDGVYVEVMHTNGGLQGFRDPIGQADFFPNFGRSQPGCGLDVSGACAHARTVELYAESINAIFTAQECASFAEIDNNQCTTTGRTARMGGPFGSVGTTGNFHLTTNGESPFTRG